MLIFFQKFHIKGTLLEFERQSLGQICSNAHSRSCSSHLSESLGLVRKCKILISVYLDTLLQQSRTFLTVLFGLSFSSYIHYRPIYTPIYTCNLLKVRGNCPLRDKNSVKFTLALIKIFCFISCYNCYHDFHM